MPDILPQVWVSLNAAGDVVGISDMEYYNRRQVERMHKGCTVTAMDRREACEKAKAYCEKRQAQKAAKAAQSDLFGAGHA
jgi:hypothetical protein